MKQTDTHTYIYGRHPVMEALMHRPDCVEAVFLIAESKDAHLQSLITEHNIAQEVLYPKQLPGGLERIVVHQGVVARISVSQLTEEYKDFITAQTPAPNTALVVLGEVQDPHNVGAVIRSAAAFGVSGVLVPPHNQAPITGVVAKSSAGMLFRMPIVTIPNVNTTLRDLKERGFWIYGLDGRADTSVSEEQFNRPSVFVIGNEGRGLRKVTAEECDTLLAIPMHERCESLNASTSAAVILYAWSVQHVVE
ncbi:MAG: 23S rRNA (guanosine(2251)-2'-O)-methyltransferase RlmB [Candidatus Pacebacteria bacterium]|nr:23S rRNA (guanosine(2251)-2'-O)-methyltransferase RlmB [Candidatus Paceibacterota bacterium]